MGLEQAHPSPEPSTIVRLTDRNLSVSRSSGTWRFEEHVKDPAELIQNTLAVSRLVSAISDDTVEIQLCQVSASRTGQTFAAWRLSLLIALHAIVRGGFVLHGALVAKEGQGLIFAGWSGAGKTTASSRLPGDWNVLTDDTVLVVPDRSGRYWAHPWPRPGTTSIERPAFRVNVNKPVVISAIFLLEKGPIDNILSLGGADAVCRLIELAEQQLFARNSAPCPRVIRNWRLKEFENIQSVVKQVPVRRLQLTLSGSFWDLLGDWCS